MTTAAFTNLGVGSGLDLNSIVTKLVALEQQPITQMQAQAAQLQTEVSSFGQVSSLMSSMQTAANALINPLLYSQSAVNSADTSVVSVSASNNVPAGSYAVAVQQLASSQTLASSTAYASSSSLVGSGTLTLELGSWDSTQANFTSQSGGSPVSIQVSSTDTISDVANKINAAGAGVTATLITDTSGVRMSLSSTSTGAANGFRVTAADDDGNNTDASGLSMLAFDPPNGTTSMQQVQVAQDAKATINGIAVTSASNTVTGVVNGLSLGLNKVSSTPVNVTASADTASVQTAIKAFVTSYNAMISYIGSQTAYDATSKVAGVLQGDSAATTLQERLRSMVGSLSGASSAFPRLSDIGLEVQRDGTLSVNQTKLDAATSNLPELKKAFMNADPSNSANDGFAKRYSDMATQALGIDGLITTRTAGLQKLISQNSDDQTALNTRVSDYQTRLVAQYTALDSNVAQLNNLSAYVTQQVANWNKSTA